MQESEGQWVHGLAAALGEGYAVTVLTSDCYPALLALTAPQEYSGMLGCECGCECGAAEALECFVPPAGGHVQAYVIMSGCIPKKSRTSFHHAVLVTA